MRIQKLSAVVANQIAAGEVIERPASVVKELLENSLDAQATMIHIDIGHGGLNQIKISDNGVGIMADDLPLAIAAHATSKISQLYDLYTISSMGFRGEALASIASISRLTLSSKPADQKHAMMLSCQGKESFHLQPCARNQGTTIEVYDLFFNAPVRKKFLKSERSEFQAIEMVVKRFALSAPHISLSLSHNDKGHLHLPAALCDKTRLLRIRKLLGKTFVEQANYLEVEHAGLHLQGWISSPEYQRSQNDKQWVYLNKRMIKDKLINHAIKQAYEHLLHPGRHPACLLYLTINPAEVDINVHPTKHEVRFQQPRLIHDFVHSRLQQVLNLSKLKKQPTLVLEKKETNHYQIHEPYLPSPLIVKESFKDNEVKQMSALFKETKHWVILNASFIVLFLCDEPYLINLTSLYRHWLSSLLTKEALPLTRRPLLVALHHIIEPHHLEGITEYQDRLSQIGLDLDLVSEDSIVIRSLPIISPYLDLKQFLSAVFNKALVPSTRELLSLLTTCQSFDAHHAREDEVEALIDYIKTLPSDKLIYSKHLSVATCRDLLNA